MTLATLLLPVEVIEGLDDAGHEEFGSVVVETAPITHDSPQFSSETDLHQHVHVLSVSVRSVQSEIEHCQQGTLSTLINLNFNFTVLQLTHGDNFARCKLRCFHG